MTLSKCDTHKTELHQIDIKPPEEVTEAPMTHKKLTIVFVP